jgi:hypothetical protein
MFEGNCSGNQNVRFWDACIETFIDEYASIAHMANLTDPTAARATATG